MKRLKIILAFLLLVAGHFFYTNRDIEPEQKCDVIIVLGAGGNENNEPNIVLEKRLERAIELFKGGYADRMLLTGGAVKDTIPEAEIMRRYCLKRGIDDDAILLEPYAKSTIDNAAFSAEVMQEHGLRSAIIVSSGTHLDRAEYLFSKELDEYEMIPARNTVLTYLMSIPMTFREIYMMRELRKMGSTSGE